MNLEDLSRRDGATLFEPAEQAERLAAARAGADCPAVPVWINARTDLFLARVGRAEERLQAVLNRAAAYAAAGADSLFVPGLVVELLLLGLVVWGLLLALVVPALRAPSRQPTTWHLTRLLGIHSATVPVVLAGASLLGWLPGGLYWLVAGILIALVGSTANAWVFLVEVVRDRRYRPVEEER